MKKFKKILASAIGAVIAFSAISSLSANALFLLIDPLETPEGYIEVKLSDSIYYITSRHATDDYIEERFIRLDFCECNYTTFEVIIDKKEIFNDICSKYSEKLDMDYYPIPFVKEIYHNITTDTVDFYDWAGEDGYCTMDPSQFENKQELIKEMSAELYKAGCISDASYKSVVYGSTMGVFSGVTIEKEYDSSDYEKIKAVADKYEGTIVVPYPETDTGYTVYCSLADYKQIMSDLETLYPENAKIEEHFSLYAASSQVGSKEVDLLAGLTTEQEILYGDLNLDGRVGISDIVMLNKNINGAVIFNENQQKAADLNANGAVDSEDLNILMQYLINIIDTLPLAN